MTGWRGTARLCLALLVLFMVGCGVKPNPQAAKELAAMRAAAQTGDAKA